MCVCVWGGIKQQQHPHSTLMLLNSSRGLHLQHSPPHPPTRTRAHTHAHTLLPRWKILLLANTSRLQGDGRGGDVSCSLQGPIPRLRWPSVTPPRTGWDVSSLERLHLTNISHPMQLPCTLTSVACSRVLHTAAVSLLAHGRCAQQGRQQLPCSSLPNRE